MRTIGIAVLLAVLLPSAAYAADCGKLKPLTLIHMTRFGDGLQERIPVTINGTVKSFVFDTGAFFTQVSRPVVEELKLPVRQGRIQMFDLAGNISRDQASIHEFIVGNMHGADQVLQVMPNPLSIDGLFAIDFFYQTDIDLDFGSDTLILFSPDHCAGQVIYWTSPASVGVVPITMDGYHITVPVMLDGKEERATIDTGATGSTITIDEAKRLFDINVGDADTPQKGVLNGDATLKTYSHQFKALAFGDVAVNNPNLTVIPNAVGRNADRTALVSSRAQSEKTQMNASVADMIIGMDVLRKLHVYIAFAEKKLYVSQVSNAPAAPVTQPAPTN